MTASLVTLIFLILNGATSQAADGTWDRAWGKDATGGGAGFEICTQTSGCWVGDDGSLGGEMYLPTGIAADDNGKIYVADQGNDRVEEFDSSGNFERAWGKGVNGGTAFGICTLASECHTGTSGGLGGEMNAPHGIATDSAGNVYVADMDNHRIQAFDSSGNFVRAWGKGVNGGSDFEVCTAASSCRAGMIGPAGGDMQRPFGVAADNSGNVYVADTDHNRIQKFDSMGDFQRTWGKGVNGGTEFEVCSVRADCKAGMVGGGLGGESSNPRGIAADNSGHVYVTDFARIEKFDSSGNFQRAWGKDVVQGGGSGFEICTVATACQAGDFEGGLGGTMNTPGGLAAGSAGDIYVSESNRIEKFDSSGNFQRAWGKNVVQAGGTGFEICTVATTCNVGEDGGGAGEVYLPSGVAVDAESDLYLADGGNNRVQKFTTDPTPPTEPTPTPTPTPTPGATITAPPAAQPPVATGKRSAALAKCKKKHGAAKKRCKKRAAAQPL